MSINSVFRLILVSRILSASSVYTCACTCSYIAWQGSGICHIISVVGQFCDSVGFVSTVIVHFDIFFQYLLCVSPDLGGTVQPQPGRLLGIRKPFHWCMVASCQQHIHSYNHFRFVQGALNMFYSRKGTWDSGWVLKYNTNTCITQIRQIRSGSLCPQQPCSCQIHLCNGVQKICMIFIQQHGGFLNLWWILFSEVTNSFRVFMQQLCLYLHYLHATFKCGLGCYPETHLCDNLPEDIS